MASKEEPALTVIIVAYNSAEVLPGLLDSLPAGLAGIDRHAIVVADNESRDESVAIALAHPVQPTVIRMGRNAGYAAGINAAAAWSRLKSHILILNPDARLKPGAARLLVERLADPAVGVAVPRILDEDGSVARSLRREPSIITAWGDAIFGSRLAARLGIGEILDDPRKYEEGGSVEWATGAALAVAAETQRLVGPWDESFFLYSEEVDYLRRVREKGRQVVYVPESVATHIGGAYHSNPRLSALMTANRIHYFRRHHGAFATLLFRLGIMANSAVRYGLGPGHRAAFWAALKRWQRAPESFPVPGVEPVIVNRSTATMSSPERGTV